MLCRPRLPRRRWAGNPRWTERLCRGEDADEHLGDYESEPGRLEARIEVHPLPDRRLLRSPVTRILSRSQSSPFLCHAQFLQRSTPVRHGIEQSSCEDCLLSADKKMTILVPLFGTESLRWLVGAPDNQHPAGVDRRYPAEHPH